MWTCRCRRSSWAFLLKAWMTGKTCLECTRGWLDSFGIYERAFALVLLIAKCGMDCLWVMTGRALPLGRTLYQCSGSCSCMPWLVTQVVLQKIKYHKKIYKKRHWKMLLIVIILSLRGDMESMLEKHLDKAKLQKSVKWWCRKRENSITKGRHRVLSLHTCLSAPSL